MNLDIEKEVAALRQMTTGKLCDRYADVFGESTRTRHRAYMIRKIAWKLQARAEGDLSERARRRAEELARDSELRLMPPKELDPSFTPEAMSAVVALDPRLPMPGTSIAREYKGRSILVHVLQDGFAFEGQRFKSLTAVAKKITGTHCNGYRFFGLEGKR